MSDIDTAFASLEFTPAADMERASLQRRLSMTFLFPAAALPDFAGDLACGYTVQPAGGKRCAAYRTLYFDTPDFAFFHAHRCGRRRREKVRIRHYDDRKLSFFEVKQRMHALRTVKQRRPRAFGDDRLHEQDLWLVRKCTRTRGALVPQVWTQFQRLTLVSRADDERVTLDFDLRFRHLDREIALPRLAIAEVKQPRLSRRTPIMAALHRRGLRRRSFSKYCAAIVAMNPDIRHNRLRPQLDVMEAIENE
jgi:hypothetical protein